MLEKQAWMDYSREIALEWKQAFDEGKQVEEYKEICDYISKKAENEDFKTLALEIRAKLIQANMRPNFIYDEPSDFESIENAKPPKRHNFACTLSEHALQNKITGAWIGRISGCLLGKPVEGLHRDILLPLLKKTNNYPMHKYIQKKDFDETVLELLENRKNHCYADTINGVAPVDDDTNYTVFALKLVEVYGKNFRSNDVLEAWLQWIPMFATCTAERVAYRNAAMGLYSPETAVYCNPYREWIGAQIRGDFFGYINPANPQKAAEMGFKDACISHVKNGIYGEMFTAAMIAAAVACDDILTVIEAGLDEIPQNCRLRHDIDLVINWFANGISADDTIEKIHKLYNEYDGYDWCHTNSNAMIVVMALLYGEKDFGKSICLAVQAAFDTDCNGATVGSIIGIMIGGDAIPACWYKCYNRKLLTSIEGYNLVDINELTLKTMNLATLK